MMYALLLALFLPLTIMFSSVERQQQEMDEAYLQGMVYYVDQLRIALPAYRIDNPSGNDAIQLSFQDLKKFLPESLQQRKPITHYVDEKGFYIVWEQPPPGLANALVERYTRVVDQSNLKPGEQLWQLAFYHIGFAKDGKLNTTRRYQAAAGGGGWLLPKKITNGSLVFTDCGSEP